MLLDTSGLLAVLDRREPFHDLAGGLFDRGRELTTHSYVLAELVALSLHRGFSATKTIAFLMDLIESPLVTVYWPGEELTVKAISFLTARPKSGYTLCDAVSFLVMRQSSLNEALTTDIHFEREGFRRLLIA